MPLAASDNRTETEISALRDEALGCQLCANALPNAPRSVVSVNASARIVLIGQAPSRRIPRRLMLAGLGRAGADDGGELIQHLGGMLGAHMVGEPADGRDTECRVQRERVHAAVAGAPGNLIKGLLGKLLNPNDGFVIKD